MKKLVIALLVTAFSIMAHAQKPNVSCKVVESPTCPSYGPASYHCSRGTNFKAVCDTYSVVTDKALAYRVKNEMQVVLGSNCEVQEVSLCPSYGPSSYHCAPRSGYKVSCVMRSKHSYSNREAALVEMQNMKYEIENRWNF